jgi:propanol-preferring alcohol dehydrogenase
MLLEQVGELTADRGPLVLADVPKPEPGPGEIRIRVSACGVCHTELDEIEGRTPPPHLPVIPGHEVVGRVDTLGEGAAQFQLGERVGVGWIFCSDGEPDENLSTEFRATGRDANGGYAEYLTVREEYAYRIPDVFSDVEAAPLLCAGAVGYRALRLCELSNGLPLGLTGFGGSAHIVLQLAQHCYPESPLYVFARDPATRAFARELGADWVGETQQSPPLAPAAIIDTTPAWQPIVAALRNLAPGGRLVINAIRKEEADKACLAELDYGAHLWHEKEIKSVANVCARDIREFLALAAEIPIKPTVEIYDFQNTNKALQDLRFKPVQGAKVLRFGA